MNYFLNCHSEESIRTRYKILAKQLHPDANPQDPEAKQKFQVMILERDQAFRKIFARSGKSSIEVDELLRGFVLDLDKLNFSSINQVAEKLAEGIPEGAGFGQIFSHVLGKLLNAEKNKNQSLDGDNKKSLE